MACHRSLLLAVLAAPLLTLPGCVLAQTTSGVGLDPVAVSRIEVGRSTRADVTQLLGPPDEVIYSNKELDPLFEQAYRYRRTRERQTAMFLLVFSTFRSDAKWDHVMVFFTPAGVVEHVGTRLDSELAEYGMPW